MPHARANRIRSNELCTNEMTKSRSIFTDSWLAAPPKPATASHIWRSVFWCAAVTLHIFRMELMLTYVKFNFVTIKSARRFLWMKIIFRRWPIRTMAPPFTPSDPFVSRSIKSHRTVYTDTHTHTRPATHSPLSTPFMLDVVRAAVNGEETTTTCTHIRVKRKMALQLSIKFCFWLLSSYKSFRLS